MLGGGVGGGGVGVGCGGGGGGGVGGVVSAVRQFNVFRPSRNVFAISSLANNIPLGEHGIRLDTQAMLAQLDPLLWESRGHHRCD